MGCRQRSIRWRGGAAALAVACIGLAACGDDDDEPDREAAEEPGTGAPDEEAQDPGDTIAEVEDSSTDETDTDGSGED